MITMASSVNATQRFPTSLPQQRIWFLEQYQPGTAAHNLWSAWRIRGRLDRAALQASLDDVARRHEVLRTVFLEAGDGSPQQVIRSATPVRIEAVALPSASDADLVSWLATAANRPFDIENGPLFRAQLLQLGLDDCALLLTVHHIACDGWSIRLLLEELTKGYERRVGVDGQPSVELPIQYADYAVWQREHLEGARLEAQLDHWRQTLAGAPPVLEFPGDHPRAPVLSVDGDCASFSVPARLVQKMRALGTAHRATPFMTLAAVFSLLLQKYTRQDDVLIGFPVSNRPQPELEALIGLFVNTLVLRTAIAPQDSFIEVLERVRESTLDALNNQDLPFERLVEAIAPARNTDHTPLVQVMLILNNAGEAELQVCGAQVSKIELPRMSSKFDITLDLTERNGAIDGVIEYRKSLFDRPTMVRLAAHFVALLEAAIATPAARVGALSLLVPAERKLLLDDWNATRMAFPAASSVHELFEEQVERTPDSIAVRSEERVLTYLELNVLANRLARRLLERGTRHGSLVGVCLDRSVEAVIALLGILKAGGAYVPLDPAYPAQRLAHVLSDTGVDVLVTRSHFTGCLPSHAAKVCLDLEEADLARLPPDNLPRIAGPMDLAYCFHTSGSTGKPKGVQIHHQALVNFLWAMRELLEFSASDITLQITPLTFDISGLEIYLPLMCGGHTVIASREDATSGERLATLIRQAGVTAFQATPATWRLLRAAEQDIRCRIALCGGEAMDPSLTRFVRQVGAAAFNVYGPTETTIWSCAKRLQSDGETAIGRPIGNTLVYILDEDRQPVPPGVTGEIYIGGAGVSKGYLNRPELTAQRFIPNPFRPDGGTLYATGDLARYRPDGDIEYQGRSDFQVKVRGFRIELGEIEAALSSAPAVQEAVVSAHLDISGEKQLVAYVVPRSESSVSVPMLRTHLRRHLPEHMVPATYVMLAALPLSHNGKVDRKALPAPSQSRAQSTDRHLVAPATPEETVLARIWSELLNLPHVSVEDNFFELGGHSLLATKVISRVRAAGLAGVSVADVFACDSLRRLALKLKPAPTSVRNEAPLPSLAVQQDRFPASYAQERMLRIAGESSLTPLHSHTWNISTTLRVRGGLDIARMQQAWHLLVDRHSALRTSFSMADGTFWQVIHPARAVPLELIDMRPSEPTFGDIELLQAMRKDVTTELRPMEGPPVKAKLYQLADSDFGLCVVVHHINSDGLSMEVLQTDLTDLYNRLDSAHWLSPPRAAQLHEFSQWQRRLETDRSPERDRLLDYWRPLLSPPAPRLRLRGYPESLDVKFLGSNLSFEIPQALASAARGRSSSASTPFVSCLTAFFLTMLSSTELDDVAVGVPFSSRTCVEWEGVIGYLSAPQVLRIRRPADGQCTVGQFVRHVNEVAVGATEHQDMPHAYLMTLLQPDRGMHFAVPFNLRFIFQNYGQSNISIPGATVEPVDLGSSNSGASRDIALYLTQREDGSLGAFMQYNASLIDQRMANRIAKRFVSALERVVSAPDMQIADFSAKCRDEDVRMSLVP